MWLECPFHHPVHHHREENRDEEIRYVMFTLAQFLGFVEVVRREGPRERPFLQSGSSQVCVSTSIYPLYIETLCSISTNTFVNSQGTDTLATLVEGIRFILCSNPSYLEAWAADKPRTHPGARGRKDFRELLEIREENMQAAHRRCAVDCLPKLSLSGPHAHSPPLRREHDLSRLDAFKISRGVQRAIGSLMITTPNGAEVHYTMSYAAVCGVQCCPRCVGSGVSTNAYCTQFCDRMNNDPAFAEWFGAIRRDIAAVSNGDRWIGQKPFPFKYVASVCTWDYQTMHTTIPHTADGRGFCFSSSSW